MNYHNVRYSLLHQLSHRLSTVIYISYHIICTHWDHRCWDISITALPEFHRKAGRTAHSSFRARTLLADTSTVTFTTNGHFYNLLNFNFERQMTSQARDNDRARNTTSSFANGRWSALSSEAPYAGLIRVHKWLVCS